MECLYLSDLDNAEYRDYITGSVACSEWLAAAPSDSLFCFCAPCTNILSYLHKLQSMDNRCTIVCSLHLMFSFWCKFLMFEAPGRMVVKTECVCWCNDPVPCRSSLAPAYIRYTCCLELFPFSALTLLVGGWQEGCTACKKIRASNSKVPIWKNYGGPGFTNSDLWENRPIKPKLKVAVVMGLVDELGTLSLLSRNC